ncbi:MAG: hypothetical protein ACM3Q1_00615 [Bacteroidales bacterium]
MVVRLALPAALLLALAAALPTRAGTLANDVAALQRDCEDRPDTICASPRVERIKARLRGSADAQLRNAPADLDAPTLERRLALGLPGTDDDGGCSSDPASGNGLGQLGLSLRRAGSDVEVRSSIGLTCASDESAYLYHWSGAGWRPYWRAEQRFARDDSYRPRQLTAVQRAPDHGLVLAAGVEQWCSSSWHRVYYQLWRAAPGQTQRLLLDGADFAFLPDIVGPLGARLDGADAYVEYLVPSVDPALHSRGTLMHYRVDGDSVRRVDPIALSPSTFVEEWLTAPWPQSAAWTEPSAREAARQWHQATRDRRNGAALMAMFADGEGRALRCRGDRSLWQVALEFPEARPKQRAAWFLVRWQEPYRFRLAAVAAKPWPNCTEDADPNGRDRRLLPQED